MGGVVDTVVGLVKGPEKPKIPEPPAPVEPVEPPPTVDTEGVQMAADAERRRQRSAAGRAATMLTGSRGVSGSDTQIGTKTLLGR